MKNQPFSMIFARNDDDLPWVAPKIPIPLEEILQYLGCIKNNVNNGDKLPTSIG